jgi:hypothetical protein
VIDWFGLFANSLWILALAGALAAFSYASWQASQEGRKLSAVLSSKGYRTIFNLAALLFCASQAMTAASLLLTILWIVLGVGILVLFIFSFSHVGKVKID